MSGIKTDSAGLNIISQGTDITENQSWDNPALVLIYTIYYKYRKYSGGMYVTRNIPEYSGILFPGQTMRSDFNTDNSSSLFFKSDGMSFTIAFEDAVVGSYYLTYIALG